MLRINSEFAKAYEERESRKLSDDSSSSDSSVHSELDTQIVSTLKAIQAKDPRVYEEDTVFYTDVARPQKEKPAYYKDVLRTQLLEEPRRFEYNADQRDLRNELAAVEVGDLLRVKEPAPGRPGAGQPAGQPGRPGAGQPAGRPGRPAGQPGQATAEAAGPAEAAGQATAEAEPTAEAEERFLAEFVARKTWEGETPQFEEDEDDDDEAFEADYNFRFEQDTEIATHRRDASSMRRADDRRKMKRQAKQQRIEQERKLKLDELRRLKNKRRKLQEKQILDEGGVALDLEGDWDPDEHDKMMAAFSDEYYNHKEKKPKFLDAADELAMDVDIPFQYKQVQAQDYGLTTEEILEADDADLNQLVSVKRLAPYREDYVVPPKKRRDWRRQRQQRRAAEQQEAPANEEEAPPKEEEKRKKKKKKKTKDDAQESQEKKKKVSKDRLASYGL